MTRAGASAGRLGALVVLAALAAAPACASDEARRWLATMHEALASRTYQGEFLHLANGRVEKLRIYHRVKDGRTAERLVNLAHPGREVIRQDAELQCYLPDEHKVLVETEPPRGTLLGTLPHFDPVLEANYRLELGEHSTVIGRPVRLLAINPRDDYRFGYRLWIDEESGIPMRTDLCDADGHVLEQVLFTALKVGGPIPDAALRPEIDASGFAWVRQGGSPRPAPEEALAWRLMQVPPGFRLSLSTEQRLPGSDRPSMHLVLSDGLASVSVFIEEPPAPPRQASEGQGRVGAAFAYTRVVAGHQVTAVGEVPPLTVETIASGVVPATPRRLVPGAPAAVAGAPQR